MFQRPLLTPLDEGSDGCRCSVEDIDTVTLNDAPEAIGFGMVRRTFIHQYCRAVGKWSIDHVSMTSHPPDVSRAPVNILLLQIKNPFRSQVCLQQITTGRMQYALGLARRSRCVKDKERMLARK